MRQRYGQACLLVTLMLLAPLAGCFGEGEENGPRSTSDVIVTPEVLTGGVFQGLTIAAETDLSAFVPYLIKNQETGFVQNSTVVDLKEGESILLSVLAPPPDRHSRRADRGLRTRALAHSCPRGIMENLVRP